MPIKDKMVYIMVAVNGIILTGAIFFLLQFYMNKTAYEEKVEIVSQIQAVLSDKEEEADDLLISLIPHIYMSEEDANLSDKMRVAVKESLSANDKKIPFTGLYFIPQSNTSEIDIQTLYETSSFEKRILVDELKIFIKPFLNTINTRGKDLNFNKKFGPKNFVFIRSIHSKANNKNIGLVAGYISLDDTKILNRLNNISRLRYLELKDENSQSAIFKFSSEKSQSKKTGMLGLRSVVTFGDTSFQLSATYEKSIETIILTIVPWIILFFGICSTLIATLFVRHTKNTSKQLLVINAEIEKRNFELGREITERERLNHILRKSERENKAIMNAISEVVFEISLTGEILFLNESWEKLTGFKPSQSVGTNLFDYIHPNDEAEQRKSVSQLIKGLRPGFRVTTSIKQDDGKYHAAEMVVSMIRMDENRNMRVVGSFSDIEERQKAEWALSEAERKYRSIWENSASGIYQMTLEGKILSANPAMASIFGFENEDLMMREVKNAHQEFFVDYQDRIRFIKGIEPTNLQEVSEFQAIRKNGDRFWIQETIRPVFNEHQELVYYEGSIEDVTKRKDAEIQLEDAKRVSDMANRAKSEFLANMSHELRTPLNSIIGFSEIIRNQVFGPIEPASYWEYARDIHESGKHLLSIINQILDISRIDAGERELKESKIDLKKTIQSILDLHLQKIRDCGLILTETDFSLMPHLIGEDVAIRQILNNILSNAIKFTQEGGRISLSGEFDEDKNYRLSVTDTGIGLDETEIKRVTSKFGVTDGRLSKSTSGIGLGLSLVQSLMRLHGGEVEIFSQKGIGTTVVLIFPSSRIAPA
jgi:PAS domain S-box-containing protein